MHSPLWRDVLVSAGDRITARNENCNRTAELIAYLVAGSSAHYPSGDARRLEAKLADFKQDPDYQLPPPSGEQQAARWARAPRTRGAPAPTGETTAEPHRCSGSAGP
ncbi:hypothetical protein HUT17_05060 (plasmid) [Nocardiopsis flavescens]|nr:hypothetical protein HUT17_05060 [Nocardiopsis flavescens]